jgi:hypothetical protein
MAMLGGFRERAKSDILEILADPRKLDVLMKKRQEKLTRRQFYAFLSALAISRNEDIGSETNEDVYDRAIKQVQGPVEGISDLYSRIVN